MSGEIGECHTLKRHLGFLRDQTWKRDTDHVPVKSIQHTVGTSIARLCWENATIEQHQLQCVQTDRKIKVTVLFSWSAPIIADQHDLGERLLSRERIPDDVRELAAIFVQFSGETQRLSRAQQIRAQ